MPRRGGHVVRDVLVVATRLERDLEGGARGTEVFRYSLGRDDLEGRVGGEEELLLAPDLPSLLEVVSLQAAGAELDSEEHFRHARARLKRVGPVVLHVGKASRLLLDEGARERVRRSWRCRRSRWDQHTFGLEVSRAALQGPHGPSLRKGQSTSSPYTVHSASTRKY